MKTLQADLNIQLLFIDKCRLTVLCTENCPPIYHCCLLLSSNIENQ